MNKIEQILNTRDDSDLEYFSEVDLRYPDKMKNKTFNFQFCPAHKKMNSEKYNE